MITDETVRQVLEFQNQRDWKPFHNPKDLAIALDLEAAELLEVFEWSGTDLVCAHRRDRIAEELADVLNCCILMADACGVDLDAALREKLRRNAEKYPVERARGRREKYTEL
jgi:NTP pyrophosphatase (non-canonical NTP hydrolase)